MHRNIKLLKWFNFFLDFRPYAPVAIIYFAFVTHSYALALGVYSVTHIASALFEVPTGVFSDLMGRKKTIVCGAIASTLSLIFFAVGGSFEILAVGGVFEGLARAFFSGNNDAFLYDTLKEGQKETELSEWLGKTGAMFQVGLGISAVIGGFIAESSLSIVMWLSVLPQCITIFLALKMRDVRVDTGEESTNIFRHLGEALNGFRKNFQLRMISLASIIDYAIEETMYQFYPVFFATLWPTWAIGLVRALSHVCSGLGFWFAHKLIKQFNAFRLLIGGELYMRTVGLLSVLFPGVLSPLLLSIDTHGLRMVAQDTLIQERFSNKERATMGSLNSFLGSILFAISAYGIGYIADIFSPAYAILVAQITLFIVVILYWLAYKSSASQTRHLL